MPIDDHCDYISKALNQELGVEIELRVLNRPGNRASLEFWLGDLEKDEGPIFTLSPLGLRRHELRVSFGQFSQPLLDQIKIADEEAYRLASAFLFQIIKKHEVVMIPEQNLDDLNITIEFELTAIRSCETTYDSFDSIDGTLGSLVVPLIAALIELIGYDDYNNKQEGALEGEMNTVTATVRERKKTNRVMCIALHGNKCAVCGFEPSSFYSDQVNGIIEVHHIEPLSELEAPRIYDPLKDLIPLCPNCHRAIHKRIPAFSPDELRANIIGG